MTHLPRDRPDPHHGAVRRVSTEGNRPPVPGTLGVPSATPSRSRSTNWGRRSWVRRCAPSEPAPRPPVGGRTGQQPPQRQYVERRRVMDGGHPAMVSAVADSLNAWNSQLGPDAVRCGRGPHGLMRAERRPNTTRLHWRCDRCGNVQPIAQGQPAEALDYDVSQGLSSASRDSAPPGVPSRAVRGDNTRATTPPHQIPRRNGEADDRGDLRDPGRSGAERDRVVVPARVCGIPWRARHVRGRRGRRADPLACPTGPTGTRGQDQRSATGRLGPPRIHGPRGRDSQPGGRGHHPRPPVATTPRNQWSECLTETAARVRRATAGECSTGAKAPQRERITSATAELRARGNHACGTRPSCAPTQRSSSRLPPSRDRGSCQSWDQ